MAWIDERPDRYRVIRDGDHVVMRIGAYRHFIRVYTHGGRGIVPHPRAVCGHPMPTDWCEHVKDFPMCGVVDCERCEEISRL
jgi:hypothetical protein